MSGKFIIMGVAGSGKTSIGEALAAQLGWTFVDGDALHPASNIAKMEKGAPLDDEDRRPWLQRVGETLRDHDGPIAVGCSALKRSYRDLIRRVARAEVRFIFLDGSRELIEARMAQRTGHFMPVSLLDSQFASLERPAPDENAIAVDISGNLGAVVGGIVEKLENLVR